MVNKWFRSIFVGHIHFKKLMKFWKFIEIQSVHRKYNSFFDLKTKRILKFFHFSFFNIKTKIEKWKNFWNSFFDFKSRNEIENFDFCFLKVVLNQNRFKKNFFLRFWFYNSIIKFEKWKIFSEIRFFISNLKTNYEIIICIFWNSF